MCSIKKVMDWLYDEYRTRHKLSKKERQFCELVESGYIARDLGGGVTYYCDYPYKSDIYWMPQSGYNYELFSPWAKFDFIQWEDDEPWSIEDLLSLEVLDD